MLSSPRALYLHDKGSLQLFNRLYLINTGEPSVLLQGHAGYFLFIIHEEKEKTTDGEKWGREERWGIDREQQQSSGLSFMCIKSFLFLALINILEEVKLRRDLSSFRGPAEGTEAAFLDPWLGCKVIKVKSSNPFAVFWVFLCETFWGQRVKMWGLMLM